MKTRRCEYPFWPACCLLAAAWLMGCAGLGRHPNVEGGASMTPPEIWLRRFEKGQVLMDFDESHRDHFFVMKSGRLKLTQRDGKVSYIKEPDTYFAALFAFLDDASFVRVEAEEPSEVYLPPADMARVAEVSPDIANTLVKKLLLLSKKRDKQLEILEAASRGQLAKIEPFLKDADWVVRRTAITALGRGLGPKEPRPESAMRLVEEFLASPIATDRRAAVEAIGARDDKFLKRNHAIIGSIAASDDDPETREAAAKALRRSDRMQ